MDTLRICGLSLEHIACAGEETKIYPIHQLEEHEKPAEVSHLTSGILPYTKSLQFSDEWFEWNEVGEKGFDGWLFPGQGGSYSSCGKWYAKGCLEHQPAYVKRFKFNCFRAECPEDFRAWMVKTAKNIVDRIEKGRANIFSRFRRPIHVTLSPPGGEWSSFESVDSIKVNSPKGLGDIVQTKWIEFKGKENFRKMRRKAIRLAKKAGLVGGCLIFHPYREICGVCGSTKDQYTKKCVRCGADKTKFLWYWSPHFHVLGYGWIVNTSDIFSKSGWIIKNHRVRKDLGATAYYQLSHAGVKAGHHVVTWFGSLSWRALKVPRPRAEEPLCPVCGCVLRMVHWCGVGDNPLSDPDVEELSEDPRDWVYML